MILITILVFVLIITSSLLFLFLADYDEKKEAVAVDPSMMPPPSSPPRTTTPPSNNKDNNNIVSKQVTPDIVGQSKIKSNSDKICFDAYIEAIVDFLAGENLQDKIPELIKRSEKNDAASYEFMCYIHGRAIVSLLIEKYIAIPD